MVVRHDDPPCAESYQRMQSPTAVERELVLRLAILLWRLRRATAIETRSFPDPERR
jgi:hypothetical protein